MKHTPGPWRVGNCGSVVAGKKGEDKFYGGYLICESVSEANARLIAAAPELLEALKAAREEIEILWKETGRNPTSPSARPWDAAISKAEGGK